MTAPSTTEWNPKWLTFLAEKGQTTEWADALPRPERIALNADFIFWNMQRMTPEQKRRFFQ